MKPELSVWNKTSTTSVLLTISLCLQSSSEFASPSKSPSLVPSPSVRVTVSCFLSHSKSVKRIQMMLPSGTWIFWTMSRLLRYPQGKLGDVKTPDVGSSGTSLPDDGEELHSRRQPLLVPLMSVWKRTWTVSVTLVMSEI